MNFRACLLLGAASLALLGCQDKTAQTAQLEPPTPLSDNDASAARVSGPIVGSDQSAPGGLMSFGRTGRLLIGAGGSAGATSSGDVTLNFVDTDIREIVKAVLGTTLQVPYSIDPTVRGTVSINTPKPVTRDQVIPILQDLLTQVNAVLVVDRGLYQVLPISETATRPVLGDIGDSAGGGDIVMLRYASAKELVKTLEPFVSHGGRIVADPNRNALVVAGDPLTRRTLTDLIEAFDVDMLAGQSYALLPVTSGTPSKVAPELEKILLAETDGPLADQIRVIPMSRINAILVASAQPRYIEDARRLLSLVDRESVSSEPTWHVYYVQNGQSTDLEYILQRAFTAQSHYRDGGQRHQSAIRQHPRIEQFFGKLVRRRDCRSSRFDRRPGVNAGSDRFKCGAEPSDLRGDAASQWRRCSAGHAATLGDWRERRRFRRRNDHYRQSPEQRAPDPRLT